MVFTDRILTACAALVRTGKRISQQTGWGFHRNDCKEVRKNMQNHADSCASEINWVVLDFDMKFQLCLFCMCNL